MAPSVISGRWFMTLRAFMDESVDDASGTFVLAGYVADVEAWAKFSAEWEQMLPTQGVLADDGGYHFKMNEMAKTEERMRRVAGFYRIIERHAIHALSCHINIRELERAAKRVKSLGVTVDWGPFRNEYTAGFRALMYFYHFHRWAGQRVTMNDKIDFYFDDSSNKAKVKKMWQAYSGATDTFKRAPYGREPLFKNDRTFLPLQAADLWAWWVRKWCAEGRDPGAMKTLDFGLWRGGKTLPRTHISMNEDQWVLTLANFLAPLVPPLHPIIDSKTGNVIRLGGPADRGP